MTNGRPLIEIAGLDKSFGGQHALAGVDFDLRSGEIHALLGENGAGKSTLIKILAGVVSRDAGEISVNGRPLDRHHDPMASSAAGLAFVHQDLGLIGSLSVAENIALSNGYTLRRGLISHRATERETQAVLVRLRSNVQADAMVGSLAQDRRVMVAIARAFSADASAIVLDEVSSSLPGPEVARLIESLKRSRHEGIGYVYVTHRLDEVFEVADRVTVLRDGRKVLTERVSNLDMSTLVEAITGSLPTSRPHRKAGLDADADLDNGAEPLLKVENLSGFGFQGPLSFRAAPGEIVGFCGLVGSGAREVAGLLGGVLRPHSGTARLGGIPMPLGRPSSLRGIGCEFLPGDRQGAGALPSLTARENLFPARRQTPACSDGRLIRPGRERGIAARILDEFSVRPATSELALEAFSGGNQQKVLMARVLRPEPRLLVLDDPTAGVDVGARAQLHDRIRQAAQAGAIVILASTDFQEIAALASSAHVLYRGSVTSVLRGDAVTEARLAAASYGASNETKEVVV